MSLLKIFSSRWLCSFHLRGKNSDTNNIFGLLQAQPVEMVARARILVGRSGEMSPNGSNFTFLPGALEQKSLLEVVARYMHQKFCAVKSNWRFSNTDCCVSEMSHRILFDLGTPLYYILRRTYLLLFFKPRGRKWERGAITETWKAPLRDEISLVFHVVPFVNELKCMKMLTSSVISKRTNNMFLLEKHIRKMKTPV